MMLAVATLAGCSSTKRTPWRDHLRRVFDNTSVQPPEPERKYWTRNDEDMFLKRIGHADYAAIGTVHVVNVYSSFSNPKRVALIFTPREVLHGKTDDFSTDERTIRLPIGEGELDFQVALNVEGRLAGRSYLLFIKQKPSRDRVEPPAGWQGSLWQPPKRLVDFVFALYAPDKSLLRQARAMYRWLKKK